MRVVSNRASRSKRRDHSALNELAERLTVRRTAAVIECLTRRIQSI